MKSSSKKSQQGITPGEDPGSSPRDQGAGCPHAVPQEGTRSWYEFILWAAVLGRELQPYGTWADWEQTPSRGGVGLPQDPGDAG